MADEKYLINRDSVKNRKRHYETIFITSPTLNDAQFKEIVEKNGRSLTENGATILRQDDWGKKRMAYMIDKHAMGHYFYFRYIGTQDSVLALERTLKLDAYVMRLQTVRLSEALLEEEIRHLVERAPREPSSAPAVRGEEDDQQLDPAASF